MSVSRSVVAYTGVVGFLAWVFGTYDFFLFGTLTPVIAMSLNWSASDIGTVMTAVSLGVFFVSLSVGPIADYLGRKMALTLTAIGAALSSGLMYFTPFLGGAGAEVYVVLVRAFSGLGTSEQAINTSYLNELLGPERRGFFYSFVQGGFNIGALLAGLFVLVFLPTLGWPRLFLVATFPAIFIVVARHWLIEPPRFVQVKKIREAYKAKDYEKVKELKKEYEVDDKKSQHFTLRQLFEKDLRRETFALTSAFTLQWCPGGIFLILGTTVLAVGKGIMLTTTFGWFAFSSFLAYLGLVLFGRLGDRFPRRDVAILTWAASAIGYLILIIAQDFWTVLISYTVGYFFQAGAYGGFFTYLGESFPTRARGTGASFVNAFGTLGTTAAFAAFSALTASGTSITMSAFYAGVVPALVAPLVLLAAKRIPPSKSLEAIMT